MANSAWSGNTAGLASATSAGLVGTGTQTFGGAKTFNGGVVLPTTGGTPATLDFYETGTFNIDFTGARTVTITFTFARIGKLIVVQWPSSIGATSSANSYNASVGQIPSRLRPVISIRFPIYVQDNSIAQTQVADFFINSDGSMNINKTIASGNFTNSGNSGPYLGSVCWTTA